MKDILAKGQGVRPRVPSQRPPAHRRSPLPRPRWSSGGPWWIAPVCWCSRPGRKAKRLLLHQLMWECDSSLAVNKSLCTQLSHERCWVHTRTAQMLLWAQPPPHPLQISPPPCRCWTGGPVGRRAGWGSYSSCQAPASPLLPSECRGFRPSRTSRCCRNTWTGGRQVLGEHFNSMIAALHSELACVVARTCTSCCSLSTASVTWS